MKSLGQNPSDEETKTLVAQNDADGSGTIDFPEFLSLISKRQNEMLENEVCVGSEYLTETYLAQKSKLGHCIQ